MIVFVQDNSMIPSIDKQRRKVCAITSITHSDVATATTMLEKTNWSLRGALNIYYIDLFKVCHLICNFVFNFLLAWLYV